MNTFTRLRAYSLTIGAALVPALLLGSAATAAPNPLSNTDDFLKGKFTNGEFVAGFTPGVADYGFSLEALLQRKALGETSSQLSAATQYLLNDSTNVLGTGSKPGYLISGDHLKLGLAGKWIFTSAAVGAKNEGLRKQVIGALLSKIDGSGDLAPDTKANTYDRAWLVLGLIANHRAKPAVQLAVRMTLNQLPDGGFNDGFTLGQSSSDGTGITLQALASAAIAATSTQRKTLETAEAKAIAYLSKTVVTDHYESYGDADVNGTAYAEMGLAAAGKPSKAIVSWLTGRVAGDGGFKTPWSAGSGDIYATAQAVVAAENHSYLNLINQGQPSGR